MFGYTVEDAIGMPVTELLCQRYRAEEKHRLAVLTRVARENRMGFKTDKIICQRNGGERFPCEVSLSHSDLPGQRLYTLIINDHPAPRPGTTADLPRRT
jgi:PAS domain S-box-containing protein